MLATIMALLGGIGGAVARILPEVIEAWKHRDDPGFELALARLELERTKAELACRLELAQAHAGRPDAPPVAIIEHNDAPAIVQPAQSLRSCLPLVEAANLLVRPVTTIWLLALYSVCKGVKVYVAFEQHVPLAEVARLVWTPDDIAIFSGAITFWFIDQSITRKEMP